MLAHRASALMDPKQLEQVSPLAWVTFNDMVNEDGKPIEFIDHRFLIQPFADMHPDQVTMKSAQVGWSVMSILKAFHAAAYLPKLNIIYTLPTANVIKDFVIPKVNTLMNRNQVVSDVVTNDSIQLKKVGERFIYYRGAFKETAAISISADLLVNDEYDRSDQHILNTYDSRLQASQYAWRWRFSNPSVPNFGVHDLYANSDQMHWFVTCHHCGHEMYMSWEEERERKPHYVDQDREIYACGNPDCNKEISDNDRRAGRWIPRYPKRARRGYHVSQLIAPWVSAKRIIDQFKESTPEFFHNFVLGLPYQAAELVVDRSSIIRANAPGRIQKVNVCMGVDNGITKHWVLGTPQGVFAYGKTDSWEDIEALIRLYNAHAVIDANPYPNVPKKLTEAYRGRVYINYYVQDTKNLGIIRWSDKDDMGVVRSDRTKLLDLVAGEINSGGITFTQAPNELEDMIYHWSNMYRTVETTDKGIERGVWLTKENKPDHWAHALAYWRIALEKATIISGGVRPHPPTPKSTPGVMIDPVRQAMPAVVDPKEEARKTTKRRRGNI